MSKHRLILGSGSPRRRELLTTAGYEFDVIVPSPEAEGELTHDAEPISLVSELAQRKAADVANQLKQQEQGNETIVIAADTVAECDGEILGKPKDQNDAERMLRKMSGQVHRVHTGLCLHNTISKTQTTRVDTTTLKMDPLSDNQLKQYLATDQWQGKAGAFGYQDGLDWVHIIQGSESNVVGLPMELLAEMLREP